MSSEFLRYSSQLIDQDDIDAVVRSLRSDFLTTGPEIAELEKEIASYVGSRFAVACSSGTSGLHLASLALGLGTDDTIVTTPNTFIGTANSARYCGAKVLFSDIDPKTANLDYSLLESNLRAWHDSGIKISALYAVHFAGRPNDMAKFHSLSREYGFKIVEDGCHALGSVYQSQDSEYPIGKSTHSEMTVFSLHPVKSITSGEGGVVTTNSQELYERLCLFRNHGMRKGSAPGFYEIRDLGYNYRITDMQCALGRSQLKKLDRFVSKRNDLASYYRSQLREPVSPLSDIESGRSAYHLFVVRIPFEKLGKSREAVMTALLSEGIQTQIHYIPIHLQPLYRDSALELPNSDNYYAECLSLPLSPAMETRDVDRVLESLNRLLQL